MPFSNVLRALIELTKCSQTELAEKIDYHPSYISKWLNGTHLPTPKAQRRVIASIALFFAQKIQDKDLSERLPLVTSHFAYHNEGASLQETLEGLLTEAYVQSQQTLEDKPQAKTPTKTLAIYGFEAIAEFIESTINSTAYFAKENLDLRTNLDLLSIPIPLVFNSLGSKEAETKGLRLRLCMSEESKPQGMDAIFNTLFSLLVQSASPDLHISTVPNDLDFLFFLVVDHFVCFFIPGEKGQIQVMYYTDEPNILKEVYHRSKHLFESSYNLLTACDSIDEELKYAQQHKKNVFYSSYFMNDTFITEPILKLLLKRKAITKRLYEKTLRSMKLLNQVMIDCPITFLISEETIIDFLRTGEMQIDRQRTYLTMDERHMVIANLAHLVDTLDDINIYVYRDYVSLFKRTHIQYSLIQLGPKVFLQKDLATMVGDLPLYYEISADFLSGTVQQLLTDILSQEDNILDKKQLSEYLHSIAKP